MKKSIRKSVFETNSSSTHSISISDRGKVEKTILDTIYPGKFGWEINLYNDAYKKASYCLTWAKNYGKEKDVERLKKVIEKGTKKKVNFVPNDDEDYCKWGYIDYQSMDVCKEAFASEENLFNFIFNNFSFLRTDNDNH